MITGGTRCTPQVNDILLTLFNSRPTFVLDVSHALQCKQDMNNVPSKTYFIFRNSYCLCYICFIIFVLTIIYVNTVGTQNTKVQRINN